MNKKAFTLTEMAIVLIVMSIVLGTFINIGSVVLDKKKISSTHDDMESIKTALISYASTHGKLPYPDFDGDGEGNDDNTSFPTTSSITYLPSLDLAQKSKDSYGVNIYYDVNDALVDSNSTSICESLKIINGYPIVVNDDNSSNYTVAAVIISSGSDKLLTGENNNTDRIYEMSVNKYQDITDTIDNANANNDIVIELTTYELMGAICDLVPQN